MSPITVGIDPGLRGGIAALDSTGAVVGLWPMPVAGGEIHAAGVADLLRSLRCFDSHQDVSRVCIEKVGAMPRQGVSSTFRFGTGWGMVRGVCATLGMGVHLAQPATWKKRVLLGLSHDKAGAVQYCANRWPHTPLILSGCRVPHDGLADALCLAAYAVHLS